MTASTTRNIAVFIASPGDLAEERLQFRNTVESLNKGFADGAGVKFEPLGWEDALALVGRRTQGVINAEIDRSDVFFLVLHRRWGQSAPDSDYTSYTEEEFYRALSRFHTGRVPEIFVFFRRVDPGQEADPGDQLKKVMTFRQSLEDTREVLYRFFENPEEFGDLVDKHLRAFVQGKLPSNEAKSTGTPLPLTAIAAVKEAEAAIMAAQAEAHENAARVDELAFSLAEEAAEAALEGKVERARQRFAQAIEGTTHLPILYLAHEFYLRTGDLSAAERVCLRCIALSSPSSGDLSTASSNLGDVYRTRGELNKAVDLYTSAFGN